MNTNFHTESRMRENCTYGSMRGRAFSTGRLALLYTLGPPPMWTCRRCSDATERVGEAEGCGQNLRRNEK